MHDTNKFLDPNKIVVLAVPEDRKTILFVCPPMECVNMLLQF